MRKWLLLSLIPVLLYSCDKEDEINTGLSQPTCEDTTDDGKFMKFNAPETARFLENYSEIPEVELTDSLVYHKLTSRKVVDQSIEFSPMLIYKTKRPTLFWAYLSYGDNQFYSWNRETFGTDDSVNIAVYNARNLGLQNGCYRLYYVFSDTGYGKVFTKGYYDLEFSTY